MSATYKTPTAPSVACATDDPRLWQFASDLSELKVFESVRKTTARDDKVRYTELAKKAAERIADYQKTFGDSREALKILAKACAVNVATLYRWKRIGDGKPATKPTHNTLRKSYFVIRRKSPCEFGQFVAGMDFDRFAEDVRDAVHLGSEDLQDGETLDVVARECVELAHRALNRRRGKEFKTTRDDLELVTVFATFKLTAVTA